MALIRHRVSTGEDENVLEMGGEVVAKWGSVVSVPGTHTEESHLRAMLFFSSVKECLSRYPDTLEGTVTLTEEEKKEEEHTKILGREDLLGRDLLGGKGEVLGGDAPSGDRDPEAELELLHQLGT